MHPRDCLEIILGVSGCVGILGKQWYNFILLGPLLVWAAVIERKKSTFDNVVAVLARNSGWRRKDTSVEDMVCQMQR